MFASPSRNVSPEVRKQPIDRREHVGLLLPADMAVIALACFVVVAQHALAIDHEDEPVLERMRRTGQGSRQPLDHDFRKRAIIKRVALVHDRLGLHVGNYANTRAVVKSAMAAPPISNRLLA